MIFDNNFLEISENYNYFIFDVWGVIHDGISPYPNVIETIKILNSQNKKICFLSNAPRRSYKVEETLLKFGVERQYYDFIMTSGEATFYDLKLNQENNFNNFGQRYYYIGPDKDIDLLDGLNYEMVDDPKIADFAVTTGFNDYNSTIEERLPQINQIIEAGLDLICVNPDMIVVRKNGDEMLCAGVIAKKYAELSNKQPIYYGKPYQSVYKITYNLLGQPNKSEILAIGDGLETDIKGANNFGIDSILVTSGILSNKIGTKYNERGDENRITEQCNIYQAFPEYIIPNL